LLHFWFIQCKPCVKEFPKLNILKSKFNDKNVEFFAVTWNNKKDLNKFFEKNRLDYNIVPSDIKLKNKFNINIFPSDILIDKEGKVEYINDLLSFEVTKRIERKINKLL
jgi:thiol-disulfide isomerase/thioredoxin